MDKCFASILIFGSLMISCNGQTDFSFPETKIEQIQIIVDHHFAENFMYSVDTILLTDSISISRTAMMFKENFVFIENDKPEILARLSFTFYGTDTTFCLDLKLTTEIEIIYYDNLDCSKNRYNRRLFSKNGIDFLVDLLRQNSFIE